MNRNYFFQLLLITGFLISMQALAQTVTWPPEVQHQAGNINHILKQRWTYPPRMTEELTRLGESFDAQMAALAALTTDDLLQKAQSHEAEDWTAKLVVLAHHRQTHFQRIEQIAKRFSPPEQRTFPSRVAPKPPKISADWVTPSDRLAWEYLSLRPKGGDDTFYVRRIGEGIASIGNPASVLTVANAFRATLSEDALPGRNKQTFQKQMIETLAHMPNTKSLRALLNIETQIQAAPEFKGGKDPAAQWRTSNKALHGVTGKALASSISSEEKTKWQAVFEAFSTQAASDPELSTDLQHLKNLQRNLEIKR